MVDQMLAYLFAVQDALQQDDSSLHEGAVRYVVAVCQRRRSAMRYLIITFTTRGRNQKYRQKFSLGGPV